MESIEETIQRLENKVREYEAHLSVKILESHNYIVTCCDGNFTVGVDQSNSTVKEAKMFPTQYTEQIASKIAANVKGARKMLARDWYKHRIDGLKQTIQLFKVTIDGRKKTTQDEKD